MRCAILGDIHSNLQALEAVLKDAHSYGCEEFHCLGDLVGYNANPVECLEIVRELPGVCVLGNHDEEAAGSHELSKFSSQARVSLEWTRSKLSEEHKEWLMGLRPVRQIRRTTLVHASLDSPTSWGYIRTSEAAEFSLACQHTPLAFFGHTHLPGIFIQGENGGVIVGDGLQLPSNKKLFINPGAVGQPRDRDWRASYMIYDEESGGLWLRRLKYDVKSAREAVLDAGLPQKIGDRLITGT